MVNEAQKNFIQKTFKEVWFVFRGGVKDVLNKIYNTCNL
ncbi:hypothetical protein CAXC1_320043 [Candidatus Xenohaliotis californiensis]|uniref:Uncharacterized protein n=1 Tax=Candidatus Xenohaliotis californiensis TaxID=84677 RepID=A0ABP0EWH4_9RICK|nr:hypothetical protein CAXC1_320043 [Candidatus Xenohaliotis californiensis]